MRVRWLGLLFLILINGVPGVTQAQGDTAWLLTQINQLRQSKGAAPLAVNALLTAAATAHSKYLATHVWTDAHTESDGSTPQTRAVAAGYAGAYVGENVVGGPKATADWAFSWWMNSTIHYRNMLGNWTEIGIGVAEGPYGRFYTLLFGNNATSPGWEAAMLMSTTAAPAAPTAGAVGATAVPAAAAQAVAQANPAATAAPPTRPPTRVPTLTPSITLTPTITYTPRATFTPTSTWTRLPPTVTPIEMEITPLSDSASDSAAPTRVAMVITAAPPAAVANPRPASPAVPDANANAAPNDPVRGIIPWAIGLQVLVVGGLVAGSLLRRRAR